MADSQRSLEAVRMDEEAAKRLLRRATELDAQLSSASSVAELREAARGAGISDEAFQRALDETRAEAMTADTRPKHRNPTFLPRRLGLVTLAALLLGLGLLLVGRAAGPRTPVDTELIATPPAPAPVAAPTPTAVPPAPTPPPPTGG